MTPSLPADEQIMAITNNVIRSQLLLLPLVLLPLALDVRRKLLDFALADHLEVALEYLDLRLGLLPLYVLDHLGERDPVGRRVEGVGCVPLEIAVDDVLTVVRVELGAPPLRAHLAEVDVPAASGAPHAPDLSDKLHLVRVRQARVVSTAPEHGLLEFLPLLLLRLLDVRPAAALVAPAYRILAEVEAVEIPD
eukprot:scaffold99425_cov48-Phaeocystis_antarctica.AAC.1